MFDAHGKTWVVDQVQHRYMKQITQVEMAGQLVAPVSGECATVDMTAVRSHDAHGVAVEPCEPHHLVAAPQGADLEE